MECFLVIVTHFFCQQELTDDRIRVVARELLQIVFRYIVQTALLKKC